MRPGEWTALLVALVAGLAFIGALNVAMSWVLP